MKVGFTGTRVGMSLRQKREFIRFLSRHADKITEFHHGDCVGADAEAHDFAVTILGVDKIHVHPPEADKMRAFRTSPHMYPPLGYLARDLKIVESTDALVACPRDGAPLPRSGTWYTIRRAKERDKPVLIFKAGD